jgi:hypothetical protein
VPDGKEIPRPTRDQLILRILSPESMHEWRKQPLRDGNAITLAVAHLVEGA